MSSRDTIRALEKDVKTSEFIIKRQNEEIKKLTEECDRLTCIISDKKNEIRRLKYQVNKYKEKVGDK